MTLKQKLKQHELWLKNNAKGARFVVSQDELINADLRGANLRYADLRSANLSGADLKGADLRNANLSFANLKNADLKNADLRNTDLRDTDLSYANGNNYKAIQIVNTKYFITILDTKVLWGCRTFTFDEIKALKFEALHTEWDLNEFKLNKKIITECIRYYRK